MSETKIVNNGMSMYVGTDSMVRDFKKIAIDALELHK